ncbi:hypothetical protein Mp_4g00400 [Marchantia polymorpha subsp. ruderalis]|uniref:Uncharacterized protein n=2 Tax=Marchantia polymorpha TaxID=3197 RepID=A0AAF6B4V0_MARPO|nr:hypothetical protein MARPO_0066s0101 [Marchantia polymorpha]BBN07034.1 hypothetical protein Mp_4g00400 [Marchantia polymorpha subsp. ruderalis]|eukprot:PTQ36150.1 hypothetical protein MARPO_0066s0101 [Marchantia polymorpha]
MFRPDGISVTQQQYIREMLTEFGLDKCKLASMPMMEKLCMLPDMQSLLANSTLHQRMVKKLIFLIHTRVKIAFVVSIVSRFMMSPKRLVLRPLSESIATSKVRNHFFKGKIASSEIYLDNVSTNKQLADILTKPRFLAELTQRCRNNNDRIGALIRSGHIFSMTDSSGNKTAGLRSFWINWQKIQRVKMNVCHTGNSSDTINWSISISSSYVIDIVIDYHPMRLEQACLEQGSVLMIPIAHTASWTGVQYQRPIELQPDSVDIGDCGFVALKMTSRLVGRIDETLSSKDIPPSRRRVNTLNIEFRQLKFVRIVLRRNQSQHDLQRHIGH